MSGQRQETMIPRGGLMAAAALVLFALAAATTVRLTGEGATRLSLSAAVESRDLRFEDGENGAVLVYDAADRRLIETLPPGSHGFVRVVLRSLARDRRQNDVGSLPPFRLTRHADGRMMLTDTSTNTQVDLAAFGSTNAESFTRLMNLRG